MLNNFLDILEDIFLIRKENSKYIELYLDKTKYYQKEINSFSLDKVFVCLLYEENLQKDLKNFKYRYNKTSNIDFINYFIRLFQENLSDLNKENTIIIGIPMYFINRFLRWYNQTYILWKWLSKKIWIPFLEIIKKTKYTTNQAWLSKEKRLNNLKNCFKINSKYNNTLKGKNIIIIDDIISTGTTANEVAKVLKSAWAKQIVGLFLATWN